jgi:transcriptional regulator GlxA family with amidase domain
MTSALAPRRPRQRTVSFLLFDGVASLDLVGPADAFAAANDLRAAEGKHAAYRIVTLGVGKRRCAAESGVLLEAHAELGSLAGCDTLIVPGGAGLRERTIGRRVADAVLRAKRTRRIASVCTGIYGLAPTGLLDGRRVTTHWRFVEDVKARFPRLLVEADAIYVRDGRFATSAGVTAGIDLALCLIEEDCGPKLALAVARELVVYLRRRGGQSQYSTPLKLQMASTDPIRETAAFIAENLDRDLSIERLAARAHLSPRQFSRRFVELLGVAPATFVADRRLDEAKRLLGEERATVDDVASATGFRSADVFRRAFERRFGVGPRDYRARFAIE